MKKTVAVLGVILIAVPVFAEQDDGSVTFWKKTKVSGTFDLNYNYNLNRPTTTAVQVAAGTAATNGYRTFDANSNTFNISLVEIALENSPTDWATFRTDLDFGRDVQAYHSFGLSGAAATAGVATDIFDLQQAYLALKAENVGNGLTFKLGKFVTMHGAEVIEASANRNASRGLLFNYAIPFAHTGIMASYPFSDMVALDLGVVNGWNNVLDNNNGKSVHAMFTIKPTEKVTWYLGGTVGPEATARDGLITALLDTTVVYAPLEAWTFTLNYDLGRVQPVTGVTSGGMPDWQGFAAYADWKTADTYGFTLRTEYFDDDVGNLAPLTGAVASGKLFEGTLTSHWYLADGLDLRFEFRHDQGNNTSFLKGNGTSKKFQDTIGSQLVYAF